MSRPARLRAWRRARWPRQWLCRLPARQLPLAAVQRLDLDQPLGAVAAVVCVCEGGGMGGISCGG